MNDNRISVFACGLIWFGAAVSVAEIEAGVQSGINWIALFTGHLLGGCILFAVGLIGASSNLNAMQTTVGAFGKSGSTFFATLNLFQLVGWTAVMLAQAAMILNEFYSNVSESVTITVLASFIAMGVFIGIRNATKATTAWMVLLSIILAVLGYRLFTANGTAVHTPKVPLDFWSAFEISVAMPLSWLPLISDYTSNTKRPVAGTAVSAIVYTVASTCMFGIGMLISTWGEEANLAFAIKEVGLGIPGFIIVGFSTIATTFLDAYSAGESAKSIYENISSKAVGIATCVVGAFLAISGIIDKYTSFLYLIASVFAPMAVVLLVSHYIKKSNPKWWNFTAWAVGFAAYHVAGASPVGPTITAVLVSSTLALL